MEPIILPLEIPEQPNPPPRPKSSDRSVVRLAAQLAADQMERENWWQDEMDVDDDEWVEQLETVITKWDGYEMARDLERRFCWSPDAMLVEILDRNWVERALEKAKKDWVSINNIKPKYDIGATVSWKGDDGWVITDTKLETAEYLVYREGSKRYAPYEDVSGETLKESKSSGS